MSKSERERLEELEQFVLDMAEAANTIELLGRHLAAQVSGKSPDEIATQITDLAEAYAAQIRARTDALRPGAAP